MKQSLQDKLILSDIRENMLDYVSIQEDIDEDKLQSAMFLAQNVDLKKLIGKDNIERCINPTTDQNIALKELVTPPLCYYAYSHLLTKFHASYTESGMTIEEVASTISEAKRVADELRSAARVFMDDVFEFFEEEGDPEDKVKEEKIMPKIFIAGGEERRGSN